MSRLGFGFSGGGAESWGLGVAICRVLSISSINDSSRQDGLTESSQDISIPRDHSPTARAGMDEAGIPSYGRCGLSSCPNIHCLLEQPLLLDDIARQFFCFSNTPSSTRRCNHAFACALKTPNASAARVLHRRTQELLDRCADGSEKRFSRFPFWLQKRLGLVYRCYGFWSDWRRFFRYHRRWMPI